MTDIMNHKARYADTNTLASSLGDFIIRRRTPTLLQLLLIFIATFIVALSLTVTAMDRLALGATLVILFGAVGSYVAVQLQRSRDLVLTTEFQNALFASALGLNNKFCLITRRDGTIVYLDRSFQKMFPDFAHQHRRTVGMLLSHGKLSQEDSKKIFAAIERNVYDKVLFNLQDSQGHSYRIIMSVEPILRPSGYILLRGREFVERSAAPADNTAPSPFNKSTISLFSHVMDTMGVGVYVTDPQGNFVYANPIFEHWLGFNEGEIISGSLSLKDIVRTGGEADLLQPSNYEGGITLRKKSGGLIKGFANQKIIRNEENKAIGYTALVHNVTGQAIEEKKKLW